jgi:hypothetical protein
MNPGTDRLLTLEEAADILGTKSLGRCGAAIRSWVFRRAGQVVENGAHCLEIGLGTGPLGSGQGGDGDSYRGGDDELQGPDDQHRVRGDPGEPFLWWVQVVGCWFPGVLISGMLAPQGQPIVMLVDAGMFADGSGAGWGEGEQAGQSVIFGAAGAVMPVLMSAI